MEYRKKEKYVPNKIWYFGIKIKKNDIINLCFVKYLIKYNRRI